MPRTDESRFDSWKEIADYLDRDLRTVSRWEKDAGLPVHRVPGNRSVFAYRAEIDAWLCGQRTTTVAVPQIEISTVGRPENTERRHKYISRMDAGVFSDWPWMQQRWPLGLGLGVLLLCTAIAGVFLYSRGESSVPRVVDASLNDRNKVANLPSLLHEPWKPEVLSVRFSRERENISFNIAGLGFGRTNRSVPFTGYSPWFRIGNITCFGISPGQCEAGFAGDSYPITFNSWSDNQILISDYKYASAGDAIEVAIWNQESKDPQNGTVWGGNIPPIKPGTPQVSSVEFSGAGKDLHITIKGVGFGNAPPGVPGVSDTEFLEIGDFTYHAPDVSYSVFFRAGYQSNSALDVIKLMYLSWSDNTIEIGGFAGAYGQNGLVVRRGDPISIDLWSTKNHLATAWGGRIP